MKIKAKEVLVNLPMVLLFDQEEDANIFAMNANTLIHGKVRVKKDVLGMLGGKYMAIFYLHRNDEYTYLCEEFRRLEQIELDSENNMP